MKWEKYNMVELESWDNLGQNFTSKRQSFLLQEMVIYLEKIIKKNEI